MFNKTYLPTILCLTLASELAASAGLSATTVPANSLQPRASNRLEAAAPRPVRRSRLTFKLPNIRASGNRVGGAARGRECSPDKTSDIEIEIKALLPETNMGLTTAQYPTFFVHVPRTSAREARFLLLNEKENQVVYEQDLALNGNAGIMSFGLPPNLAPLEVGKKYKWSFSIACDSKGGDRSVDPTVEGWVQRVQLPTTFTNNLKETSVRNRPAWYANAGLWHDSLKSLADLRQANPKDATLAEDWIALLSSVKLEQIAKDPIFQLDSIAAMP